MNLAFPPFEPDRSIYTSGSSALANVVPVADGWGPLPQLTVISSALADTCLGAWYVRTSSGTFRIFAGTQTKLYEYNSATLGWTDITRASGGNYAVPDGDEWSAAVFGDNFIAVNLANEPQYIDIDSGTAMADLAGSPPKAKYVGSAGDYLLLGHIADHSNRVMCSGINDAAYWTVGQRGCDFQDFPTGEEFMGILSAEKGAILAQRTRFRVMTVLANGAFSFRTDEVNNARGIISPLSLAQIGPGRFVYYSADGFFMGIEGEPIGENRVDKWFDGRVERSLLHLVKMKPDPFQKIVWIRAPESSTSFFTFGYHWGLNRWVPPTDDNWTMMAALVTPAVTIDGLDNLYASIDEIDLPFDSRLFSGGSPTMAVFNASNELCYPTGDARAATLQTVDAELNPGFHTFLSGAELAGDCTEFTMQAVTSNKFGGTRTTGSAVTPHSDTGICHFRSEAKFHALKVNVTAAASWNQAIGVHNIEHVRAGQR